MKLYYYVTCLTFCFIRWNIICVFLEASCKSKACGEPCKLNEDVGVCDGIGHCRHVMENPCAIHGCDVKKCGETCITGDMQGWCNIDGKCDPFDEQPVCGKFLLMSFLYAYTTYHHE